MKSNPIQERRTMREIKAIAEKFAGDISFEEYFSNRKDAAQELLKLAQELAELTNQEKIQFQTVQAINTDEIESHKTF